MGYKSAHSTGATRRSIILTIRTAARPVEFRSEREPVLLKRQVALDVLRPHLRSMRARRYVIPRVGDQEGLATN